MEMEYDIEGRCGKKMMHSTSLNTSFLREMLSERKPEGRLTEHAMITPKGR